MHQSSLDCAAFSVLEFEWFLNEYEMTTFIMHQNNNFFFLKKIDTVSGSSE